jgi:TRAP-type C4-dicarboxylate transport system permease small subunit
MDEMRWFGALVRAIEGLAAVFLAIMTALTFVAVILRYVFNYVIPDAFDVARLLLGIGIFWGIAAANYRNEHIGMDLAWSLAGPRGRRRIDIFSSLVTLAAFFVFWWMLTFKVRDTFATGETTFDLHLPLWGFYGVAWVGITAGCLLLAVRVLRLLADRPDTRKEPQDALPLE